MKQLLSEDQKGMTTVCIKCFVFFFDFFFAISDNNVYYRTGTYGNATLPGNAWQIVDGSFKKVAAGQDIVVAIDEEDNVFTRVGKVADFHNKEI